MSTGLVMMKCCCVRRWTGSWAWAAQMQWTNGASRSFLAVQSVPGIPDGLTANLLGTAFELPYYQFVVQYDGFIHVTHSNGSGSGWLSVGAWTRLEVWVGDTLAGTLYHMPWQYWLYEPVQGSVQSWVPTTADFPCRAGDVIRFNAIEKFPGSNPNAWSLWNDELFENLSGTLSVPCLYPYFAVDLL